MDYRHISNTMQHVSVTVTSAQIPHHAPSLHQNRSSENLLSRCHFSSGPEWTTASLPGPLLTIQEADPPQARVQRGPDVHALVQGHDHSLLQVQPVVGADRQAQQPQAADCKDAAQQCQGLPAARAHCHGGGEG